MEAKMQAEAVDINVVELIEQLRIKRNTYVEKKAANKEALEAFILSRTIDVNEEAELKQEVCRLEADIKLLSTAAYLQDKSIGKKPFPGIGIRENEKVSFNYDPAQAYDWAREKDMCLQLDTVAFEAICNTPSKPSFVIVEKETIIAATIATDLNKALEVA